MHPRLVQAERDGLDSQLRSLRRELKEYDDLKGGKRRRLKYGALVELPLLLIKARIARGWTHKTLGELIGLPEEQIQHYEATEYAGASLTRLVEMAGVLEIDFAGAVVLRELGAGAEKPAAA